MQPTNPISNSPHSTPAIPDSASFHLNPPIPGPLNPSSHDPSRLHLFRAAGTFYEKTTPDLRRELMRAIVHRSPATFRAVYDLFNLRSIGVSFFAFYRFARKIRARGELLGLVEATSAQRERISTVLHRLAGVQAIDALRRSGEPGAAAGVLRNAQIYSRQRRLELRAEAHAARVEVANIRAESRLDVARMMKEARRDVAQMKEDSRRDVARMRSGNAAPQNPDQAP